MAYGTSNRSSKKKENLDRHLKIDNPLDSHLKPVKIGDDVTGLQLADKDVKIEGDLTLAGESSIGGDTSIGGDLTLAGDLAVNGDTITTDGNMTLDSSGAITLDSTGDIVIENEGTSFGAFNTNTANKLKLVSSTDYNVELHSQGTGDVKLESSDNIIITATNGVSINTDGTFIMKKDGTEFSVANSAYAGMILGYTTVGRDATPASYDVTTTILPVHDDLKVTFKAPPSGAVEIFISIMVDIDQAGRNLILGLSTTDRSTGFTTLEDIYEDMTFAGGGNDNIQHTHRWVVTGLTAGDIDTYWLAAGAEANGRVDLRWGGSASAMGDASEPYEYAPFIMKVTALPTAVADYAVYG